jgi:tRNA (mo5U34)-methyltransferase
MSSTAADSNTPRMPEFWHSVSLPDGTQVSGQKSVTVEDEWDWWKLPTDLSGKTFLDVACFDGGFSVEAHKRGAERVVGVDPVQTAGNRWIQERGDWFEYVQAGVYDPEFLALGKFDFVLCAGLYYHCCDIMQLFCNLRRVTSGVVWIEGVIDHKGKNKKPMFEFFPGDELNDDITNWWRPNPKGLLAMLQACGLRPIAHDQRGDRMIVQAVPSSEFPPHNHDCDSRMHTHEQWNPDD